MTYDHEKPDLGGVRWRIIISRRVNVTVQPTPNLKETVPTFYAIN